MSAPSENPGTPPSPPRPRPAVGGRLIAVVLGLTALVVAMLVAFALPAVNGGPREIPVGAAGPGQAVAALEKATAGTEWEITRYEDARALTDAVEDREIVGGVLVAPAGVTLYQATAAGPQATAALTAMATAVAERQHAELTVEDLAPFPEDDPRGAGFSAAALPMVFGGILPAIALARLFPGRTGLRLAGGLLFSLTAGFAVTAVLQFGTGSLSGDYAATALGLSLGIAALAFTLLGLEALFGLPGFGVGAALMMLLANPLSGFATGPHWLPGGWSDLGQVLPPGASGSLLRANAFFDGTGATGPALVLAGWTVLGAALLLIGGRLRARRQDGAEPTAS
ncbi:hypothetical protein [Streptomyces abyssomicinicus]|uniref:hypothetical protein n=1 Tax=Streptomyces abyssomicinicus TaxID=574929 RepID=UPI001FE3FAEE|nr:hypothetical protein [Streptomyces abyssomicinicus]